MEAAATIEAKKHGLRQGQDGAWTLALVLHPNDVPNWLLTAPMGQRLAVVVAALDEDAKKQPEKPKERKRFDEMPLSQQAGIRCNDPAFQDWLVDTYGIPTDTIGKGADATVAAIVRRVCGIDSRTELNKHDGAALLWRDLDHRFLSETGRVTEIR